MRILFSSIFWGFLLILIGVLLILNNFFGYNIPIWNIVWPTVLILVGIRIMIGHDSQRKKFGRAVFNEVEIDIKEGKEDFNSIFGKGTYDLTKINFSGKKTVAVELNTIFGSSILKIDPKVPLKIKASSAFGNAKFSDGNSSAFGESIYVTKSYDKNKPHILVEAKVVFGELSIEEV